MTRNPGLLVVANHSKRRSGMSNGFIISVIAILAVLVALGLPETRRAREPARRSQCKNNLKQIMLGLLNYEDQHHAFPPAYTVDENGKPLHSWRTLILPYMDQAALYKNLDLTKPWDDPVNVTASKTIVREYQCPSGQYPDGHTTYLTVVTPNSCLRPAQPRLSSEITDSHAETLVVIEVDVEHAVPWMAPTDADEAMLLALGGKTTGPTHAGGRHAGFVDGSVRTLEVELSAAKLHALISISGNDN